MIRTTLFYISLMFILATFGLLFTSIWMWSGKWLLTAIVSSCATAVFVCGTGVTLIGVVENSEDIIKLIKGKL